MPCGKDSDLNSINFVSKIRTRTNLPTSSTVNTLEIYKWVHKEKQVMDKYERAHKNQNARNSHRMWIILNIKM